MSRYCSKVKQRSAPVVPIKFVLLIPRVNAIGSAQTPNPTSSLVYGAPRLDEIGRCDPRTLREIALRAAAGMTDPRRVPFLGYRRANEQYGLVARRDQAHIYGHTPHTLLALAEARYGVAVIPTQLRNRGHRLDLSRETAAR
jgi:hypothetical protein